MNFIDLDLMWNIIIQLWVYRLSESRFVPLAGFHFQNDQIMVRAKHQFVAILSCVRCKSAETEHLTWNYITVTWLWTYHAVMCCRLEVIHILFDQIQVILSRWYSAGDSDGAQSHLGMRGSRCDVIGRARLEDQECVACLVLSIVANRFFFLKSNQLH